MTPLAIEYCSDFPSISGYGHAARAHARALIEQGVDVRCTVHRHDTIQCQDDVFDAFWKNWWPVISTKKDARPIRLIHETPEFFRQRPGYNIGMVAWETDRIPDYPIGGSPQNNWVAQMNSMQEIWTFCHSAKKAFVDSGVKVPVHVFGHPMDHELYMPGDRDYAWNYSDEIKTRFRFITNGQLSERKNFAELLLAYIVEFSGKDRDKVALLFKTYQNDFSNDQRKAVEEYVRGVRALTKIPLELQPPIYLSTNLIPEEMMPHFYTSGDVFVWTSRGEGFALPLAESMLCGVPVITHTFSSMGDLVNEKNGFTYDHLVAPVLGMPHVPWYTSMQNWAQPDVNDLRRKMRYCFEHQDVVKSRGKRARQDMIDWFSYTAVGQRMVGRLQEISAQLTATARG